MSRFTAALHIALSKPLSDYTSVLLSLVCLSRAEFQITYPVAWDEEQNEHIPLHHLHTVWRRKRSLRASPSFNINLTAFGNNFHLEVWENKELLAPGFKIYHRNPHHGEEAETSKDSTTSQRKDASGSTEVKDGDSGEVVHEQRSSAEQAGGATSVEDEVGSREVKDDWRSEVKEGGVGVRVSSEEEVDMELSCQMTGRVRSHGDTPVALSVCHGMVSLSMVWVHG